MKKVLIITYYWPPAGGSGVQRWLQMSAYLKDYGWQPIVYHPANAKYQVFDESLAAEISPDVIQISRKIKDPATLYSKVGGKKNQVGAGMSTKGKKKSFVQKMAIWMRGNLFIPDSRKYWIKPSVRFLKKYFSENPFDAIISTGPPHSMHIIAKKLSEKTGKPWLADFRDPWTNIDFYRDLNLSARADKKHRRLEKEVLTNADAVVSVGSTLARELEELGAEKCEVIPNGYDPGKYTDADPGSDRKEFIVSHIGVMPAARNPEFLWEAMAELKSENAMFAEKLSIVLVGNVDGAVPESIEKAGLSTYLDLPGTVSHKEAIVLQKKSAVLMLLINDAPNAKGILTGKVFEYMAANRPVLATGPVDGDVAAILNECEAGQMFGKSEKDKAKAYLLELFEAYLQGKTYSNNRKKVENYSRKAQAGQIVEILNRI